MSQVKLTNRENEVLHCLVKHYGSQKKVSQELVITPATLKTHLNNLYGKLFAHSTTELILLALEKGLIPLNNPVMNNESGGPDKSV